MTFVVPRGTATLAQRPLQMSGPMNCHVNSGKGVWAFREANASAHWSRRDGSVDGGGLTAAEAAVHTGNENRDRS